MSCFPSEPTAAPELDSLGCRGLALLVATAGWHLLEDPQVRSKDSLEAWRMHPVALRLFTSGFSRAKKTCTIPPGV